MAEKRSPAREEELGDKSATPGTELFRSSRRLWEIRDPAAVQAALAAIVTSSDDAIISKDLNGTILTWNRGAERMFGYSEDEVIGKSILLLLPANRVHEEDTILGSLRSGKHIDHFETERVTKDGRNIQVSISVSPIKDSSGHIVGAAKIARDITISKEAAILRSRIAAIVDSADDAIVGKDLTGTVISWNAGAERLFGYRADEIIGHSILLLVPPERHDEERRVLATLGRGDRIDHFETVRVRKDGRRVAVSLSVSPIRDSTGKVVGAAKIARDISARRREDEEREALLQRERSARASAEKANRTKDEFLAMVSHELRSPLSPILAWTSMLRRGQLDRGKSERALETIERNVRTQAQLVDDLLDTSRIAAGKLRLEVSQMIVEDVVRRAVDVVRPTAEAKQIRLQSVLDTETGRISGDPARLQQVVWNLLSNAIKFTPTGGRVQVIVERVNSHIEIAVSDSGRGISSESKSRLFEPFQQGTNAIDGVHGGLGLGLAIAQSIVQLHGGTIVADSAGENLGATFTVKLPVTPSIRIAGENARRHPTLSELPSVLHGGKPLLDVRALVVDDEPDSNEAVSMILSAAGAEVRVAASVRGAMEQLSNWRPSVIVSDIGMPGEDGYELIRRVRALDNGLGAVPAVALTAYAASGDRIRIFSSGFQAHVAKPIEPEELVAVVQSVTQSSRPSLSES